MKVAIVILNWNGKAHLQHFLPSVIANSKGAEIILADNASDDDSVAYVQTNYPSVTIILNNTNLGFAGGYNAALEKVDADIYVLLNSDVEVTPNWLTPILARMSDNQIVACQPKILSYSNKDKFEHAGAAGGFIDKDGYPFCRGRIFETAELDLGQYDTAREVFWATGACLFIKSGAFHDAGGFDDKFFAHMEEIDLCWRLKKMGYQVWVEPASSVYHLGGGTLNYMSPKKTFLNFRNNLYMVHKNYSGWIFPKMFRRLTLDGIAAVKFLVGFQFIHFVQVFKAHIHYYMNLKYLNAERKRIRKESRITKTDNILRESIVINYFLKGIKKFSDLRPKL